MEIKNALQRFEELERQADAELGAIDVMDAKMTAFYADEVLGTTAPDVVVRQLARSVEKTYIALGAALPPHVSAACGTLKPRDS